MQKKFKNGWLLSVAVVALGAMVFSAKAQNPYDVAVKVSATISTSPAKITLSWIQNNGASSYNISRKSVNSSSWTPVANLGGSTLSWSDSNVAVGQAYEYQIVAPTSAGYTATGYIYAGINANMIESRGRILLVVDNTYASQLSSELARLQQDLSGDGWTVVRRDVSRGDSPVAVKNVIKSEYNNGGLRSVLLFGHVAVAYSGDFNPDGHDNHKGAWASDSYYGDMDGNWTDSSANDTSSANSWNWNVPGDGKFDQSTIPSDLELEVGRVDLANMTCFSNKTPSRSELDLLRQYLNKDHNFRHGLLNIERRAVICDNWGTPYGESFAESAWGIGTALFGLQNTIGLAPNTYVSTLSAGSALFSWAGGGGSYYTCGGVGGSDDFALNDVKGVFNLCLGSYFGDWDNESNFLRAPLGGTTAALTSGWSGRPEWWLHHMALGETIGFGARLTMNNGPGGTYSPQYSSSRGVHITLHGDPTLRMHPVIPPSNLQGVTAGSAVTLTWAPSTDSAIQGYYVYRATSANGPFTRVTANLLTAPTYIDPSAPAGAVYMVRAVKLETSASGTYFNPSQGVFYTSGSTGGGGGTTAPIAPSNLAATSNGSSSIRLAWSDNSANESGFKIERKVGVAGTYGTVTTTAAGATSFADSGLAAGTVYFYRLSAVNSAGASATVEATAATAAASGVTASATFVQTDSTTQGTWKGVYGSDGAQVMGDSVSLPGYVQITPAGNSEWTWEYSTTDVRAPQRISAADRIASVWYLDGSFTVDLNFTDGQTHRTAMYFVDWDLSGRTQTAEILDAASGAVLNSQTLSGFGSGKYLVWDLKGNVRVRLTKVSGFNAVLSGLFFGPAGGSSGGGMQQTTAASLSQSKVNVRINGTSGQVFKIYSSSNLTSWTEVTTVTLSGATYDYVDAGGGIGKFYKAIPQ
ncbi:MAG TPA: fibronectin type III domain-containing protein [Verrucomicrobiae bacterium]